MNIYNRLLTEDINRLLMCLFILHFIWLDSFRRRRFGSVRLANLRMGLFSSFGLTLLLIYYVN
jgi:hypothetical protein